MVTAESVKAKLQGLIATANAATGNADADLTTAVNALAAGFGQGGGTTVPHVLDVTEYVHSEAWEGDALGNAENFLKVFCNSADTTDRKLYLCYVSNNTAAQSYRANYVLFQRHAQGAAISLNARNNWTNFSVGTSASRSLWISAGATVTVIRFAVGESEGE